MTRAFSPNHQESFSTLGTSASPGEEIYEKGPKAVRKGNPWRAGANGYLQIAPALYQYTAIDDCTRIRVLALYKRRSAANSLLFLEKVIEEFPFPIQRIQTDRGREFFAYAFQEKLIEYGIRFRPLKPASPHLNGKVERSQRTDLEEFYATADLDARDLEQALLAWQDHYNHFRPHGSLNGLTPWEKWYELAKLTPCWDDIEALYDASKERIRHPEYRVDLQLRNVERK